MGILSHYYAKVKNYFDKYHGQFWVDFGKTVRKKRRARAPSVDGTRAALLSEETVGQSLQVLLIGLDHLLDHLAADGAGLTAGQVAVVAFLQVDADLP